MNFQLSFQQLTFHFQKSIRSNRMQLIFRFQKLIFHQQARRFKQLTRCRKTRYRNARNNRSFIILRFSLTFRFSQSTRQNREQIHSHFQLRFQ